jgi:hypothetical protein
MSEIAIGPLITVDNYRTWYEVTSYVVTACHGVWGGGGYEG